MDVLARTKELLGSLAEVTESGTRVARYKIEVANLDRKLGLAMRRIGERAWRLQTEGRTDVLGDGDVQRAFEEIRQLRARMEVIRQDVERNRAKAAEEAGRAARIVKEEAGRAVAAVRGAVSAKGGARRKKETSDLQP
jgi:pyridoxal biosynthesis lyase PdxS